MFYDFIHISGLTSSKEATLKAVKLSQSKMRYPNLWDLPVHVMPISPLNAGGKVAILMTGGTQGSNHCLTNGWSFSGLDTLGRVYQEREWLVWPLRRLVGLKLAPGVVEVLPSSPQSKPSFQPTQLASKSASGNSSAKATHNRQLNIMRPQKP